MNSVTTRMKLNRILRISLAGFCMLAFSRRQVPELWSVSITR